MLRGREGKEVVLLYNITLARRKIPMSYAWKGCGSKMCVLYCALRAWALHVPMGGAPAPFPIALPGAS